jgi:hypothetical protein
MRLIPRSLTLCLLFQIMDVRRLERRTSSMSTMRSNQLSYTSLGLLTIALTNPIVKAQFFALTGQCCDPRLQGFGEDAAQSCSGYSAENLAVIRHVGINLRSRDKKTIGVKTKRLQTGWDDNYLKTVLSALNIVTS